MPPGLSPSPFWYTHTAAVQRPSNAQDTAGGRDPAWAVVTGLSALACSVQPETGRAIELYASRGLEVDTTVYFRVPVAVRPDDRLAIGSAKYLVVALGDEAEQGRVVWVSCKRLYGS